MILLSVVLIVGQVWLDLTMPDYMSEITRLVQTEGSAMADIWANGGMMLLCALGSMVLSVATGYLAARMAASFSMRLRRDIFLPDTLRRCRPAQPADRLDSPG